jgi:general L-amino acid transport system substrate-binding protein
LGTLLIRLSERREEKPMNSRGLAPIVAVLAVLILVVTGCTTPAVAPPAEVTREVTRIVEVPAAGEAAAQPAAAAQETPAVGAPVPAPAAGQRLDIVRQRGRVACGVHTSLPGFGYLDAAGRNEGFDVDFCRAVAVAVFNDPEAVEFVPITAAERGPALQTAEIDLLSRNATWTSSRDAQWGNFTGVMFYDGQGMMVGADTGFTQLEDLDGATICVTTGTTTELNLADAFRRRNLQFTPVTFEDTPSVYGAYEQGRCDAATSDKSQLAAVKSGFAVPDDHIIMDVTMSKEPLSPAVPHGDDQWFDIVKTVTFVLINAEELEITSENVDQLMASDSPEIRRFLGVEGSFGQADLGLSNDFAANVIRTIGNYGEMYDRQFGSNGQAFPLDRDMNRLWTDGGLLYAPPIR